MPCSARANQRLRCCRDERNTRSAHGVRAGSRKQRAHDMTRTRPCTRTVLHAKHGQCSRCSKPSHHHRTSTWHFAARLPIGVPQFREQLPHRTRRHDTTRIHDVLPQVYVCTMTNLDLKVGARQSWPNGGEGSSLGTHVPNSRCLSPV